MSEWWPANHLSMIYEIAFMKMTQFHIRGYQGHNVLSCNQHTAILKKK